MSMVVDLITRGRQILGKWRRSALRTVDRALHSRRRDRALGTVREALPVDRVLFLCLGNICRSPFAEHALRARFNPQEESPRVESAGFIGPDRPSPPEMQHPALERGVDLSEHRSRVATAGMLESADLVVVMGPRLLRRLRREFSGDATPVILLGDLDPETIPGRTIRDPYGQPPEVFAEVAGRIERCVAVLAEELAAARSGRTSRTHRGGR